MALSTATLLWNTVRLTVVVTALCAVIGTVPPGASSGRTFPAGGCGRCSSWCPSPSRTSSSASAGSSLSTWVQGFRGAVLVMTLAVYPLVYLPGRGQPARRRPGPGGGRAQPRRRAARTSVRITLGQAAVAILGGCLLVALVHPRRVRRIRDPRLPDLHHRDLHRVRLVRHSRRLRPLARACRARASLVLVRRGRSRGGAGQPIGPGAQRLTPPQAARSLATVPVLLGFLRLLVLAASGCRSARASTGSSRAGPRIRGRRVARLERRWHTALYSGWRRRCSPRVMALPVALLAVRHPRPCDRILESSTFLVLAMPGRRHRPRPLVLRRALRRRFRLPDAPLLVLAYAIMFFPLALVGVRASVAQAPVALRGGGRFVSASARLRAFWRVTLPLIGARARQRRSASSSSRR